MNPGPLASRRRPVARHQAARKGCSRRAKDQSVHPVTGGQRAEGSVIAVEHQQVGTSADLKAPTGSPRSHATAVQAGVEEPRCAAGLLSWRRGHIALAQGQPLAVLQPTQLFGPGANDLAVRSHRQRHAGLQPARQVAKAVAQVGFGGGAQNNASAAGSHAGNLLRRGMRRKRLRRYVDRLQALLSGLMWMGVYQECPQAEYTGIAMEYGTVPVPEVINSLRADQWMQSHPEAPAGARAAVKQRIRDAFYTDTPEWKLRIVEQGRDAALQAVSRLARD